MPPELAGSALLIGLLVVGVVAALCMSWSDAQDPLLCVPWSEVFMEFGIWAPLAGIVLIALMAIYAPTVYIRKTNKILKLLEKIEANTRK
jgi:hypothetical protein